MLILDDDDDLRAALGETLEAIFGRPWVGAGSVDELRALEANLSACDLAILDINLGQVAGGEIGLERAQLVHGPRADPRASEDGFQCLPERGAQVVVVVENQHGAPGHRLPVQNLGTQPTAVRR